MGLAQMQALGSGRGFRRPYVDEINARTPYLPQLYAQKRSQEHQDRMWGLEQRGLAQNKKFQTAELNLREDMAKEARKRNRLAKNLGYAQLGVAGGLGLYDAMGQPSLSDIGSFFTGSGGGGELLDIGGFGVGDPGILPEVEGFGGGGYDLFGGILGDAVSEIVDWGGIF